ncbi:hypothetical protein IWX90DRAFT_258193 [Phyllosticta citrichinensis]|uniref:Uncharacterized protein n=1 Tax=Phyllosticta citrichinensis TaxID=1130410 RepID=A0ABR1XRW0_9PEZI
MVIRLDPTVLWVRRGAAAQDKGGRAGRQAGREILRIVAGITLTPSRMGRLTRRATTVSKRDFCVGKQWNHLVPPSLSQLLASSRQTLTRTADSTHANSWSVPSCCSSAAPYIWMAWFGRERGGQTGRRVLRKYEHARVGFSLLLFSQRCPLVARAKAPRMPTECQPVRIAPTLVLRGRLSRQAGRQAGRQSSGHPARQVAIRGRTRRSRRAVLWQLGAVAGRGWPPLHSRAGRWWSLWWWRRTGGPWCLVATTGTGHELVFFDFFSRARP